MNPEPVDYFEQMTDLNEKINCLKPDIDTSYRSLSDAVIAYHHATAFKPYCKNNDILLEGLRRTHILDALISIGIKDYIHTTINTLDEITLKEKQME